MLYSATSNDDVAAFAQMIRNKRSPKLAEFLIDNGLFNVCIDPELDFARQFFDMSMGSWIAFVIDTEWQMMQKTDFRDDFFLDVTYHILYGIDTEQDDSVGGYSQREIDLICDFINFGD